MNLGKFTEFSMNRKFHDPNPNQEFLVTLLYFIFCKDSQKTFEDLNTEGLNGKPDYKSMSDKNEAPGNILSQLVSMFNLTLAVGT